MVGAAEGGAAVGWKLIMALSIAASLSGRVGVSPLAGAGGSSCVVLSSHWGLGAGGTDISKTNYLLFLDIAEVAIAAGTQIWLSLPEVASAFTRAVNEL